tara:strand:+ start:3906 stop:4124 length:219 start_codon:yes stop_codon:yes gene_type:complete
MQSAVKADRTLNESDITMSDRQQSEPSLRHAKERKSKGDEPKSRKEILNNRGNAAKGDEFIVIIIQEAGQIV